jgi:hypothetical protein
VIFVGGLVCGAVVGGIFVVKSIQHAVLHPESVPARVSARLERRLKLTPSQTAQVRDALVKRQQSLLSIRRDVQPRLEQEFDGLESDISNVLDEQQRDEWRTMAENFRSTWMPRVPASQPAAAE